MGLVQLVVTALVRPGLHCATVRASRDAMVLRGRQRHCVLVCVQRADGVALGRQTKAVMDHAHLESGAMLAQARAR